MRQFLIASALLVRRASVRTVMRQMYLPARAATREEERVAQENVNPAIRES
jgi:hypothetical protein